jgi:hypothetical protein
MIPCAGVSRGPGTTVASRTMTVHLIALGILLSLAAVVVLVLRRR